MIGLDVKPSLGFRFVLLVFATVVFAVTGQAQAVTVSVNVAGTAARWL
jgi:hypothetical protein